MIQTSRYFVQVFGSPDCALERIVTTEVNREYGLWATAWAAACVCNCDGHGRKRWALIVSGEDPGAAVVVKRHGEA